MFEAKIREERGRGHEIEEKAAGAEEMVVVIAGVIGVQAATEEIAETEERRTSGPAESRRPVVAEAARAVRGLMKNVGEADRGVKKWVAAEVRGAMMEAKEAVMTGSDRGVKKGAAVVVADSD